MTLMKKDYCKPETRYISLAGPYVLVMGSLDVTAGGDSGSGGHGGTLNSRDVFWEDFDEDVLQDMDREELKELE